MGRSSVGRGLVNSCLHCVFLRDLPDYGIRGFVECLVLKCYLLEKNTNGKDHVGEGMEITFRCSTSVNSSSYSWNRGNITQSRVESNVRLFRGHVTHSLK